LYNKDGDDYKEYNSNLQVREKTQTTDLQHFMELIRKHCYDNPPSASKYFSAEQARDIINYCQTTYFKHYNLYKYCADEKQKQKCKVEQIMIDEPQVMDPLKTFEEIMEEKTEEV
jgi:undecaprenyl pyrophosphate synthase